MGSGRLKALMGALALGGLLVAALGRSPAAAPDARVRVDERPTVSVIAARGNTVTWRGGAGPFRVQRADDPRGPWRTVASTAVSSVRDRPPEPGIYWYRVAPATGPPSAAASSDDVRMSARIGSDGGVLRPTTGTIALLIPPGAVERPTTFTIRQLPSAPKTHTGGIFISRAFEIGPSGATFDPPAVLELQADGPGGALPEDASIGARWWDDDAGRWSNLGRTTVNATASHVRTRITHLSLWAAAATTVPHGGYGAGTDFCGSCHASHDAARAAALVAPTERETCYTCHDGSGAETDVRSAFGEVVLGSSIRVSSHPVAAPAAGVQLTCSDCHTPHQPLSEDTALLRALQPDGTYLYSPPDEPIGNTFCYACHGPASDLPAPFGDHSGFETAVHNTNGTIPMPASGSGIRCLACHEPHGADDPRLTDADQEDLCFTCHTAGDPISPQGTNPAGAFSGSQNDYSTTDGTGIREYHHPIGPLEQDAGARALECSSCHNVHVAERDGSSTGSPIVDPRDTATPWPVTWDAAASPTTKGDIDAFCLVCHVGPTDTAPIAPGPSVPYTVRLTDDSRVLDDDGTPHDTFTAEQWREGSAHGPSGAALACTACHDVHGSTNAYLLRQHVISPEGSTTNDVEGFDGVRGDAGVLRTFCQTCHPTLPDDPDHGAGAYCTECHSHGAGGF